MRRFMNTAWLLFVLTGLLLTATIIANAAGPASAQTLAGTYMYAAPQGWGGNPYGSYRDSCRDIRDNGSRVSASCQRTDGSWNNTALDYRGCRGQIINDNGNLRCGSSGSWQGGGDWQNGLPRGDFRQTCRDVGMRGDDLVARCQRRDGGWQRTKLDDAARCRGSIINDDGNLRCGADQGWRGHDHDGDRDDNRWQGGGYQGGVPRGDYMRTCQNTRMNGNRLEANCQRRNGSWNSTALDNANNCSAIINDDGNLRCGSGSTRQGWGGGNGQAPRGNYMQSCQNARMNGNRLEANCQRRNGSWNNTALDNPNNCRDIVNDDGNLRCNR